VEAVLMGDEDQAIAWRAAELREQQRFDRGQAEERRVFEAKQRRDRAAFDARRILRFSQQFGVNGRSQLGDEGPTETKRPDLGLRDLIRASEAARIAHRSKSRMGAWCRQHAINGAAGFSVQIKGRWLSPGRDFSGTWRAVRAIELPAPSDLSASAIERLPRIRPSSPRRQGARNRGRSAAAAQAQDDLARKLGYRK
jgi:hypothetical protein